MKKLLNIFATTGLVATSTTSIIACGNKDDDKIPDSPIDRNQVIKQFKLEVNKIINDHLNSIQDNLSQLAENAEY